MTQLPGGEQMGIRPGVRHDIPPQIFFLWEAASALGRSIVPKAICWQMAQRPLEYPENQGWQLQQCWALTSTSLNARGYESCEFLARPPDSPRFPARERGIRARLGGLSSAARR